MTRYCIKCNKTKDISEFRKYLSGRNVGLYHSYCKSCAKKHRGNRTNQSRQYRLKYPQKTKAQAKLNSVLVNNKKRKRIIKSQICQICGVKTKTIAHHADYTDVLNVIWLCCNCHNDIHKILKEREVK